MMKTACIVHYNTPELTEAAILSLRKHSGEGWRIVVLDNSDKRPFRVKIHGVEVIDNTSAQCIDFDSELAKYPDKCTLYARVSIYGSVKHMLSVQYLWDRLKRPFLLMDSDIIIKDDVSFLWDEQYAASGKVQWLSRVQRLEKDRMLPFLCFINVPLLQKHGARYFDPDRSWWLHPGENNPANWYDTGAVMLEDIRKGKPYLVGRNWSALTRCFAHYGSASWRRNGLEDQLQWLEQHRQFWEPTAGYRLNWTALKTQTQAVESEILR